VVVDEMDVARDQDPVVEVVVVKKAKSLARNGPVTMKSVKKSATNALRMSQL